MSSLKTQLYCPISNMHAKFDGALTGGISVFSGAE